VEVGVVATPFSQTIDAVKRMMLELLYTYMTELFVHLYIHDGGPANGIEQFRRVARERSRSMSRMDIFAMHNDLDSDMRISLFSIDERRHTDGRWMYFWTASV
jgi:hypothetical protein